MPEVKDKMTGKTVASMSYDDKGMAAANKMAADDPGLMVTDGRNRSQQMYEGGGMTGMSMIGRPQYMKGGKMMYKHGGKAHDMKKMGHGGMMKKYEEGGKALKEVDSSENPGLSKLPKEVRNKMGYMKEGGKTKDGPSFFGGDFFQKSGRKRRQERRKTRKAKKLAMEKKRQSELKKIKQRKSKTAITAGSKSKTKFGAAKVTKPKAQIAKEKAAKKAADDAKYTAAVKRHQKLIKEGKTPTKTSLPALIKARDSYVKQGKRGSEGYNMIQNRINQAYGVKKRHKTKK
tara:strand:- start:128 stop:991 length:864 start_codon:yes stop_codon:yes gene_type:complete